MLHPRQHHQVPAYPRRDHRHGEGGGGVQGPRARGHAAEQAAGQGPGRWGWQRYDPPAGTQLSCSKALPADIVCGGISVFYRQLRSLVGWVFSVRSVSKELSFIKHIPGEHPEKLNIVISVI